MAEQQDETRRDPVLAEVERRARDRWGIAALLVVAVLAALVLLVLDDAAARYAPIVGAAFLVVAALFAGSVVAQERRERGIVRALLAERERTSALGARVGALEAMHRAVTEVAAAETLDELYERTLRSALAMTGADRAVVWLRVADTLTVAASRGAGAPQVGTVAGVDEGAAGLVARTGEALRSGAGAEWASPAGAGAPTVAAPLRLPDRVVGVVVLQRDDVERPFAEADRTVVALFAEQTALAMRSATRLDVERQRGSERARQLAQHGEMTTTLVHDLKAPVAAVAGYLQLLRERDDRFDARRRRQVYADVLAEADRVGELLQGLLEAASAEQGGQLRTEQVDVVALLHEVARTAQGLAHRQGAPRDVEIEAMPGARVPADRGALLRVVTNLVDNAVAYSPPGSTIRLRARVAAGQVVLAVEDEGDGMPDGVRHRAFDQFVSGGGSSGLGLYVVRVLVDAHGGEVRLEERPGGGTRAEVVLPAPSVETAAAGPTAARSDAGRPPR
jgi:two-component system, OmpR family, sensor histidine kinase KdpD